MPITGLTTPPILLDGAEVADQPFPHAILPDCLSREAEEALLAWFETDAPWRRVATDFYEQDEFDLLAAPPPPGAVGLVDGHVLAGLRETMGQMFGATLQPRQTLVAHRLTAGHRIGIHNDHLPGGETHRLTVQVNRGCDAVAGGLFMLFSGADPTDVHRVLVPASRSGVAFAIGNQSHHAVSTVHGGERYTLVYSFFC